MGFLSTRLARQIAEQCRPCWIFASSQVGARERASTGMPEPEVGTSKLGGAPDMPVGVPWPRDDDGATLDFLAQIRLDDGPPLLGIPTTGVVLFFAGIDEQERIEHKVLLAKGDAKLVRVARPDGKRIPTSVDYQPLPIEWKASLALPRTRRRYELDIGEVEQWQIQEALDAAALGREYSIGEEFTGLALTRFGGWPLDDDYWGKTALSAYIVNSSFADHGDYHRDFQRRYDFEHGKRPIEELRTSSTWHRLARLVEGADAYLEWVRDSTIDHVSGIAEWKQLLSLDSHMEIGMCFHDAGAYEFVFHGDGWSTGNAHTYLELIL